MGTIGRRSPSSTFSRCRHTSSSRCCSPGASSNLITANSRFCATQSWATADSNILKLSRALEIPEEKLQAIKSWATSDMFNELERAVMAATDELIGRNMVKNATCAALKRHFSDEQIVERFFVITTYRIHGMMLRAFHLEFDNDTTKRMEEVPDPPVNMQNVPGSRERSEE
jgi:hypothetical protein